MTPSSPGRKWLLTLAAWTALIFGLMTIFAGGQALFGSPQARASVGQYVPFVLWFNFLAGFAYVGCAVAIFKRMAWASRLAVTITIATLLVAAGFAWHVSAGGAFETRTAIALLLRLSIWTLISIICIRFAATMQKPTPSAAVHP